MTTAVPLIYSFPEFSGVAEAVADLIITAQNSALSKTHTLTTNDTDDHNSPILSPPHRSLSLSNTSICTAMSDKDKDKEKRNIPDDGTPHSTAINTSQSVSSQIRKKKKENNRRFKIGISGGSLLNVLHEGLLDRSDIHWDKWDIYFADERLVPASSPESNYGQAKAKLFDKIDPENPHGLPNVYPINFSLVDDPQECADDYEKTLIKGFASKDSVKLPMFDLILLGCAPDGHVASLFPNHETLRENYAWCVPVETAPVGPRKRISLSVPVICHSHMVAFVVEGATKAPVLRTIMERPDKGLPASIINEKAAGRIAWFVDDEAISDVVGITKKRYKFTATK